ncbi:MAG: hypothetical protein ABIJ34_00060 [archaeon]
MNSYAKAIDHKYIKNIKSALGILLIAALGIIFFRKNLIFIVSIVSCVVVMMHKRYMGIVLGIDICLVMTLLASSKYGSIVGAIVGGSSYLLGMIISMEVSKSPMVTIYGTIFYILVGLAAFFIPISLIYSVPLLFILIFAVLFSIGAFFVGAPVNFLIQYFISNIIANLLFIQIFGGLLRLIY